MVQTQTILFLHSNAKCFFTKLRPLAKTCTMSRCCPLYITRGVTTTPFPEFEHDTSLNTHEKLHNFSIDKPEQFWGTLAKSRLHWDKEFSQIRDCNINEGKIRWFMDGELNASGLLLCVISLRFDSRFIFLLCIINQLEIQSRQYIWKSNLESGLTEQKINLEIKSNTHCHCIFCPELSFLLRYTPSLSMPILQ